MKILVPTDFSQVAGYALDVAIAFVKKFGGQITLVHFIQYPKSLDLVEIESLIREDVRASFVARATTKCEAIQSSLEAEQVDCDFKVSEGDLTDGIEDIIRVGAFDLVVMGSHGASGKKEWFLGSNTQKVVRKIRKNILVVKNPLKTLKFEKALYVSGLFENEKEAFQRFLKMAKDLEISELHIMSVDTSSYFSQPTILISEVLEDFKSLAQGFNVSTHFYKDLSVDAGVRHFTQEHPVDLVVISNHVRHPIKRIFSGSNVEMIVNHCEVPVLTLDY